MASGEDEAMSWRRGGGPVEDEDTNARGAGAADPRTMDPEASAIWDEVNSIEEEPRYFIQYFRSRFRERAVDEIHTLYEDNFVKLSERYYKSSAWPSAAAVSYLVEHDELFLLFYKELAFRHLYTLYGRSQPTIAEQVQSWENYRDLFSAFLNGDMVDLELPPSWLWDIIDEFIYQFETWCQYRSRVTNKTERDMDQLRDIDEEWNVNEVLQYLHALVNKSNVCPWMLNGNKPTASTDPNSEDFDLSCLAVYRYFGFFAIVGLLRVHCLLGDYRLALMVLQSLDFNHSTALFTHVTACHISVYYFMGFAHLMLRRYEDAGRVFGTTLLQIGRIKQSHVRSYQYEQVNKRIDQMLALLAICITFHPQYVDEATMSTLREKFGDKLSRMRGADETAFMELFTYASPKFITPAPADFTGEDYHMDAAKLQVKLFSSEVQQQLLLPEIRSYLKMYTTIELRKLANLMDTDQETFRSHLLRLKHKSFCARSESSTMRTPTLQGAEATPSSEFDFFVDGNIVHVADSKVESRHGEFFIKQIEKLTELSRVPISRDMFRGAKQIPSGGGPRQK